MRVENTGAVRSDLMARLRQRPGDVDSRMQLFRVCVIDGQWQRALDQLAIASQLDGTVSDTTLLYQRNIACEAQRYRVFSGQDAPLFLGEPPAWVGYLVQALRSQEGQASAVLVHAALDAGTCPEGTINGEAFAWLADADSRLGPVLEAFIDGKYYWIPFVHLAAVSIDEPEDLLDLAWCPVTISLANGGTCHGFIPTRYCASYQTASDDIKLARLTQWMPWADDLQTGEGQRMLVTDQAEYALLDCREITFHVSSPVLS
jgi:type VI secretion system protein ImpE